MHAKAEKRVSSSSLNDRQKTELILGESCLDGSISVKIGSHEQLRTLKAQEPNVSLIVATARISDSGSLAISGACAECGCAGVGVLLWMRVVVDVGVQVWVYRWNARLKVKHWKSRCMCGCVGVQMSKRGLLTD
eukprot:1150974-Pelagomonas_calceolata.AAC.4